MYTQLKTYTVCAKYVNKYLIIKDYIAHCHIPHLRFYLELLAARKMISFIWLRQQQRRHVSKLLYYHRVSLCSLSLTTNNFSHTAVQRLVMAGRGYKSNTFLGTPVWYLRPKLAIPSSEFLVILSTLVLTYLDKQGFYCTSQT